MSACPHLEDRLQIYPAGDSPQMLLQLYVEKLNFTGILGKA
jgi:hypothetical protein